MKAINVTQAFTPPIEEYESYLDGIWERKWLTNRGPLVTELEAKLCDYLGVSNCLAVGNGTLALQLAIKALGLKGEIITTPFSYVATASSIVWENCTPIFVDIDNEYLTIDERKIEDAITPNTSAILAVHVYGNPCNVEAIKEIADRRALKVIYDAAHCFAVDYDGKSILNWGDVSTLSFHATKLFHTGEGGGVVCNDAELATHLFNHHNFGHKGPEEFFGLGINAKLSELNAAMGLAVLPHVDSIRSERQALSKIYDEILKSTPLRQPKIREGTDLNYAYCPVIFPEEASLLRAKQLLNDRQIFPRRYFYPPLNRLPYVGNIELAIVDSISTRILCLPLYAGLATSDAERIATIITEAF